jgi:hypothetical protein
VLLIALIMVIATAASLFPVTPQPQSYHHFADQREWLGIPNFGDVASNLGFAIVGIWGLIELLRRGPRGIVFTDPRERWLYELIFVGMLLTAFGSSYYHLAPDNPRLVWDRLPMTIVFMSLVAAVIAERISVNGYGPRCWQRELPVCWYGVPVNYMGMAICVFMRRCRRDRFWFCCWRCFYPRDTRVDRISRWWLASMCWPRF